MKPLEPVRLGVESGWHVARALEASVQPISPSVVGTHEVGGVAGALRTDPRAPMTADVEECVHFAGRVAREHDLLLLVVNGEKIARLGNLADVTHAVPVAAEDAFHVALKDAWLHVEAAGQAYSRHVGLDQSVDDLVGTRVRVG